MLFKYHMNELFTIINYIILNQFYYSLIATIQNHRPELFLNNNFKPTLIPSFNSDPQLFGISFYH